MAELLSPGVFPVEVDFSAYIQGQSTSTFGIAGVFEKGPIGEAVLVGSLDEAVAKFGSYLNGRYGLFALKNFFENGGSRAYVVRVVHYAAGVATSALASLNIVDRAGTPLNTLKVEALTPGVWGNNLTTRIEASTAYATTGFNLVVRLNGTVVETHKDLLIGSANAVSEDYVEKRINGVSEFIRVTDLASATAAPNNLPKLTVAASGDPLASGADGVTGLVPSDFLGDVVSGAPGLAAFDGVDVNFLAIPGESATATGQTLAAGLIAYAEARKDLIAIVEAPQGLKPSGIVDFRMATGTFSGSGSAFNSSYGALYGPWLKGKHPVTGRDIVLPPSGFVAGIYARNDRQGAVWTAPAGLNRATVIGANGPEVKVSKADVDVAYPKGVNLILPVVGALTVDGQKTLLLKGSKLDRVNVRRLMAFTEKGVQDASQFLLFEPNNPATWNAFIRLVEPFVRGIKQGGGFEDYRIVCDASINTPAVVNRNEMKARVQVIPVGTAEFITVEFAIAPTGTDFSEA